MRELMQQATKANALTHDCSIDILVWGMASLHPIETCDVILIIGKQKEGVLSISTQRVYLN